MRAERLPLVPAEVSILVPGRPVNPKNMRGLGRHKHWRMVADARLKACQAMLTARLGARLDRWPWEPDVPKVVTFTAQLRHLLDDDNLRLALSPIRDALGDAGLIGKTPGTVRGQGRVKDGPGDGHSFEYRQIKAPTPAHLGVVVTVRARPA